MGNTLVTYLTASLPVEGLTFEDTSLGFWSGYKRLEYYDAVLFRSVVRFPAGKSDVSALHRLRIEEVKCLEL
jgi:hypothetical protein